MPRKIDDLLEKSWPETGKIVGVCVKAEPWVSPKKKTPAIRLSWTDETNHFAWDDLLFLTSKAISRVALVAARVCGFDGDLPDNDNEVLDMLRDFILANAQGKKAIVNIEETTETIIHESGPDIGRKSTIKRKRVAFGGYQAVPELPDYVAPTKPPDKPDEKDDLPF